MVKQIILDSKISKLRRQNKLTLSFPDVNSNYSVRPLNSYIKPYIMLKFKKSGEKWCDVGNFYYLCKQDIILYKITHAFFR